MTASTRPASPDALRTVLAAGALGVTLAGLGSAAESPGNTAPGLLGWLLAPTLALAVLLLGRGWPGVTLLLSVGLVLAYYTSGRAAIGMELLLAPALVNGAERGRLRWASMVAGGTLVLTYVLRLVVVHQELRILGVQFLTAVAVCAGALGLGEAIRVRHAWRGEVARRHALELAAQEAALLARAEDERRMLARDIHDVLAHTLVVVGQQASIAQATMTTRPEQAGEALRLVTETVRDARREVRDVVRLLRSEDSDARSPTAGLADLDALVDRFRDGVVIRVDGGPLPPLGTAIDSTAYRIISEALTNVVRHSTAATATVTLKADTDRLKVVVQDDGRASRALVPGNGVRGMRERANLVGGTLTVRSDLNGVTVAADLPLGGPMTQPLRVVLVDDQPLVRAGLRTLLELPDDGHEIRVVGEAEPGRAALGQARQHRPDVVLMDIRMPVLDGISALREMRADQSLRGTPVLMLTTFDTDEFVFDSLAAGADGFLTKDCAPEA